MNKTLIISVLLATGAAGIFLGLEASAEVKMSLSLLWIIAVLWLSEAIHLTATALLVPVLAVVMGLLSVPAALENFAHPVIFLFFGGFALASALHEQGMDRWLANRILKRTKGRLDQAFIMLSGATALLSMWISNTAITAIMLPLALGLIADKEGLPKKTKAFGLLAIAYSANIGGMGTIIGSPPNAIVSAELNISFVEWLYFGIPLVIMLWPLMMVVLYRTLRPDFLNNQVHVNQEAFSWNRERKLLIAIFALTVFGWVFGGPLSDLLSVESQFDSWVALTAVVLLCTTRVVSWSRIQASTDWGVLLLFGGGITLSQVLQASGGASFLGTELASVIQGWGAVLVLAALISFVVFLTELTSNTATTALLVPIFISLPAGIVDPSFAGLAIGISSCCAFMLPVATPPNALVHGTGMVPQRVMMRNGINLNIMAILALTLFFYLMSLVTLSA